MLALWAVNKVAAVRLEFTTDPAPLGYELAVVCVTCRTAWLKPLRSNVPALTTKSLTVTTVAVGMTSNVLATPILVVPSFWKNAPEL